MSVSFTDYRSDTFNMLNFVAPAHEGLKANRHVLSAAGDIFRKHGVNGIAGVTLLHRHFDMDKSERLVESWNNDAGWIEVKPEGDTDDLVPYLWKLSVGDDGVSLSPIEFCHGDSSFGDEAKPLVSALATATPFIEEFAQLLKGTDTEGVFGLCLLHRDSILMDDKHVHFEETDRERRISTMTVMPVDELHSATSVQTHWRFGPAGSDQEIVVCSQCEAGAASAC